MTEQKSPRHTAALAYAEQGIPVFPCLVNGKRPATENGFRDASCDPAQIDAWWSAADYNIGLEPERAGWCVIDPDMGHGKNGEASLAALEAEFGALPPTYTVRTPGGGRHLYFEGSLPGTQGNLKNGLGPDVDTRGRGSYVVVPPSVIDGRAYEVISNADVTPLPEWIDRRVRRSVERHVSAIQNLDTRASVDRARLLLASNVQRGDVAIEGQGGDTRTFQIACELLNLGLSPEVSWSLLEEIWNPHCRPPWSHEELGVKIENASRYAQNEPGAWGVAPAAETFGHALDKLVADSKQQGRSRFHMEDETEQETGADPSWIIPEMIPEASTILLVGPSGSYKSFFALDLALSIATRTATSNTAPLLVGPTFYAAAEGRANIKKARRRAWKLARGVDAVPDFYVGPAPMLALPEEVQQFGDEIARRCEGRKPRLIVFDTLAKVMAGLNENDAADAGKFIKLCDSLVDQFGCSVLALHHTGKDEGRGARGSSAFLAGFDTVLEAKAHKATKALEIRVRKHKDAEEREAPWTYEGKAIGTSLVFQPTNAEEHRTLTAQDDQFDPRKIGAALQRLNAYGAENGVTSHVLATELVPPGGDAEVAASLINKTARALGALARSKLEAYCTRNGRELSWFMPAPTK